MPTSPFGMSWEKHDESLRYIFGVVRLWEIPQEHVLASLMAGASVETTVEIAERLAAVEAPRQERSDLIGLLAGLATISVARDVVLAALRRRQMLDELLKESGLAEAFIEEGERRMAQAALEGRFGPLAEDVLTAIHRADEATLLELVTHVSTETMEQIRARLGLN